VGGCSEDAHEPTEKAKVRISVAIVVQLLSKVKVGDAAMASARDCVQLDSWAEHSGESELTDEDNGIEIKQVPHCWEGDGGLKRTLSRVPRYIEDVLLDADVAQVNCCGPFPVPMLKVLFAAKEASGIRLGVGQAEVLEAVLLDVEDGVEVEAGTGGTGGVAGDVGGVVAEAVGKLADVATGVEEGMDNSSEVAVDAMATEGMMEEDVVGIAPAIGGLVQVPRATETGYEPIDGNVCVTAKVRRGKRAAR